MGNIISINSYRSNRCNQNLSPDPQAACRRAELGELVTSIERPLARLQERMEHFCAKGFSPTLLAAKLAELQPSIETFRQFCATQEGPCVYVSSAQQKGIKELQDSLAVIERFVALTEGAYSQILRTERHRPVLLPTISSQDWISKETYDWSGFAYVGGRDFVLPHFERLIRDSKQTLSDGDFVQSERYWKQAEELISSHSIH